MTTAGSNRLAEEASPYLRQHADNPVNWQPWDATALAAAKERDVPIFLSVGYAACHWCHVMEAESFQDESVAALLNDHFVPVKVDREERPDVDRVYQTICQQVTGSGGWPLSVWLTPDGKPFYVGTYFPPESRRNIPGFRDLLEGIADSWTSADRSELEARADQWADALAGELEAVPDTPGELPDESSLDSAAESAVRAADREYGGFGRGGPKFPQAGRLHLLLRAFDRTDRAVYREVVRETLDAMAAGGLFDHVGGGFHRYCTDRDWTVPHFEKMLYDQAQLVRAYLAGYQVTGQERYAEVATETLSFVERELSHPDGGFYSTLDAQSRPVGSSAAAEAEEGAFYVWTPEEILDAVADVGGSDSPETGVDGLTDAARTNAELFCARYGVDETGNFEDRTTVLKVTEPVESLAEEYDMAVAEIENRLETTSDTVFEARSKRPRPARDEKVLASWNGLMISAFAEAALVVDQTYAVRAAAALSFVRDQLWDEDQERLGRRYKDGDVQIGGYLEDYAFLGRAALDLYQTTGEVESLAFALDLASVIETEFWNADRGTLYFTPSSGESLVARPQELTDQSTPSSTGVAVELLLALDHFVDHDRYLTIAERTLETHAERLESDPLRHVSLVLAADTYAVGDLELTIVASDPPEDWNRRIGATYLPNRLISYRPSSDDELATWLRTLGLEEVPPIWAERSQRNGKPTVYACRSFTCSPPQHDLEDALEWATDLAPGGPSGG